MTTPPPEPPGDQPGKLEQHLNSAEVEALLNVSGCAERPDPLPTPEELQRDFPNYEILALLGRGGMGAVYQARQTALDRFVALKLLPQALGADPEFTLRFRREARAMARLSHPNIVTIYDFGETPDGRPFFIMEFIEGANLHDLIRSGALEGSAPSLPRPATRLHGIDGAMPSTPALDAKQALAIAAQVCDALAYAHGEGVVHRDIKPANILVDLRGRVKIADFGLARLLGGEVESGLTMTGTVMGTLDYMAPEQRRGEAVDHRADIYALGIVLYEMLCREVPHGIFDPPSSKVGCDPRLDRIVATAMQSEPERRFQSTREMHEAVEAARTAVLAPVLAPPRALAPPRPPRPPVPAAPAAGRPLLLGSQSRRYTAYLLATLLVVLGAGGFLWWKMNALRRESAAHAAVPKPATIRLWTRADEIPKNTNAQLENGTLLLGVPAGKKGTLIHMKPQSRDAIVRASVRMNPDSYAAQIGLRRTEPEHDSYRLAVVNNARSIQLETVHRDKGELLRSWKLPRNYGASEWARLELRAIGGEVTVIVDGETLGTVHDTSQPQRGGVGIFAEANGYFRDIEYVPLDAPPASPK